MNKPKSLREILKEKADAPGIIYPCNRAIWVVSSKSPGGSIFLFDRRGSFVEFENHG